MYTLLSEVSVHSHKTFFEGSHKIKYIVFKYMDKINFFLIIIIEFAIIDVHYFICVYKCTIHL